VTGDSVLSIVQIFATLIGSIIQALATLIGIIVAIWIARREFRETREQLRFSTYENVTAAGRQLMSQISERPGALAGILKHFGLSDRVEAGSAHLGALLQIQIYENMYYRHKKGFFPAELWDEWDNSMRDSFRSEPFATVWTESKVKRYLWKDFVYYVDESYFPTSTN
jgi:hypothetical protein